MCLLLTHVNNHTGGTTTTTERPIDPGTAHVIEAAEYVATWPTLRSPEELAEPIIASLYALVLWFDDRAAALQFSRSEGELIEETTELVDRANEVRALVRNATLSMVRADFWPITNRVRRDVPSNLPPSK